MLEEERIKYIDIDKLIPNKYQPRKKFDETALQELANSIKKFGIINPILARKNNNFYEIIAGERRWRAARSIGMTTVPVILKNIDDSKMAELALVENIQRENLTPIEEAKSIYEIMKLSKMTQEEVGKILGKTQSSIANKLRLLNLPNEIQDALNNKKISERHARTLLTVDNEEQQINLLHKIIDEKLTVKVLEKIIQDNKNKKENNSIKYNISNIIIEKEEKESDKMNQGNFFPNYNQPQNRNTVNNQIDEQNFNNMVNNQNATLNSLNTQMNNSSQNPKINNTEQFNPQPKNMSQISNENINLYQQPSVDNMQPLFNNTNENPIPNFGQSFSETQQNIKNDAIVAPEIDIPLFNKEINNKQLDNLNNGQSLQNDNPTTTMFPDTPIFSPRTDTSNMMSNDEVPNLENTAAEIPVVVEPSKTKLEILKDFLKQQEIPYKLYNNNIFDCIIIELQK